MRIAKEIDILNLETRRAILDEMKGSENQARKQDYLKRYEIYKDKTKKHVIAGLVAEGLKPTTVAQMSNRAANISICRKIVNKKAMSYAGGIHRTTGSEAADAQLSYLSRLTEQDSKMKKADRYRELYKNCLVQLVPEVKVSESTEGAAKYCLKLAVIPPWQYDVVENPFDREDPMVVILSDFTDRQGSYGTDKKDNVIADSPEDASMGTKEQYIWWSPNYHFTTDKEGSVIAAKSPEGLINPIGMFPFANNAEDQDGQFWAQGGDDLIDGSVLVNKLVTDMNFIAYLQGFGQMVVTGKNIQEKNFAWGPNNACLIEYSEDDPVPSVQILSANPPLDSWMQIVLQYVALLLTTNNLSASTVSANLSVDNFASGIAMMVERAESTESLEDKQKGYVIVERELFKIMRAWQNLYYDLGALCSEFEAVGKVDESLELSVKFLDSKPTVTESEKLENIKKRKELGINEQVDLIMIDNPDMTKEEAQEKLLRIAAEKVAKVVGAITAAIAKDGNNGESGEYPDEDKDTEVNS